MPPLRVRPATPVVEMMPKGTAWPKACVAWSTSPVMQPAPTLAVRPLGSTRTPLIAERSMTSPSSTLASPGPLCPPPRIAIGRLIVAAEIHGGDHVGRVDAARDQLRALVDHAVVELAGVVVTRIGLLNDGSTQRRRKTGNGLVFHDALQGGNHDPPDLYFGARRGMTNRPLFLLGSAKRLCQPSARLRVGTGCCYH